MKIISKKIATSVGVGTLLAAGSVAFAPQASASPWSPGCATMKWDDTGRCVGGQEAKGFLHGFTCAGPIAGGPIGIGVALADKDYRDKCFNPDNIPD